MGTIWVKEFTGGLDTRRLPEATAGGALIKAENGHITRGGEFEKRAAFVPEYELPAGTVGLAYNRTSLVVFGSGTEPVGIPAGVTYQRLEHPDGTPTLIDVPSFDLYSGRIYAVGVFSDGSRHHFYDGVRVEDWYDGRARAGFQVVSGEPIPPAAATADIVVTGGAPGDQVTSITVNGVALLAAPVNHTGDNGTTAEDIATAINAFTSTPDYTAEASGNIVTISAVTTGPSPNGFVVATAVTGTFGLTDSAVMAGGADTLYATIVVRVNGVAIMSAPVQWGTSNSLTADAIATAITSDVSTPDYSAIAVDETVVVLAEDPGTAPNGLSVTFTLTNGFTVSPASTTMEGGSEEEDTYPPGTFVKTGGSKVYSVSGPNLHFSGIGEPTQWTTDVVGAGFIDLSSQASGSEDLTAIVKYQQWMAVFAENTVQIEYVDPDPTLNRQVQVLSNTGTLSPRSVTQFGDNDIFYLHESGIRSLQARDSSNSAATFDLGNPVDSLVLEKLASMTLDDRQKIFGFIEPLSGRFWMTMQDVIFVFSFFNRAKVSAWSTYLPTFENDDGDQEEFQVEEAVVFRRRVYLRSGDQILCFGGIETGADYDNSVAEAWLPYLDANAPTRMKRWLGIDAAMEGVWSVSSAMQPINLDAEDAVSILFRTTFNDPKIPMLGDSSHIGPRFRSTGTGPAKLSSVVIHYEGDDIED